MNVRFLNRNRRKRNRVLSNLLNPLTLLLNISATFALIGIFSPPTPLWQYFIVLPVALLVLYWLLARNIIESINGRYERLVIQTDINICPSTYWDGSGEDNWIPKTLVKTNFAAGYFILEYINFLERIPLKKGIERVSYFFNDKKTSFNDPEKGINTFLEIKNFVGNYDNNLNKKLSQISSEDKTGILKDCNDFIMILEDLKNKDVKFALVFLSQPVWNSQLHFDFRERGYCI